MIKKNSKNIILVLFVVITGIFYIDSFMRSGIEEDFFHRYILIFMEL